MKHKTYQVCGVGSEARQNLIGLSSPTHKPYKVLPPTKASYKPYRFANTLFHNRIINKTYQVCGTGHEARQNLIGLKDKTQNPANIISFQKPQPRRPITRSCEWLNLATTHLKIRLSLQHSF